MAHIVVNDVTPVNSYTATSGQTEFTVSFPFFTDASLEVYKTLSGATPNDATDKLTLTTHYTVTGAGNVEGATKKITLTSGNEAASGDKIIIRRNEPTSRTSDLQEQGDFLAATHNDEQDKVIMLIQQIEELLGRSITKGVTGGNWDAQSTVISSAGDPVSAQDVVTKAYAESQNLSLFTATGTTSVTSAGTPTLALTDGGKVFDVNQSGTYAITIPLASSVNFEDGTSITFLNRGSGAVTFTRASGVALYIYNGVDAPANSNKSLGTGGVCTLMNLSGDNWAIFGNTALVNT